MRNKAIKDPNNKVKEGFLSQYGRKEWTHHFKNNLILWSGQIKQVQNKKWDFKKNKCYSKLSLEIKIMNDILPMETAFRKMDKIWIITIGLREMMIKIWNQFCLRWIEKK